MEVSSHILSVVNPGHLPEKKPVLLIFSGRAMKVKRFPTILSRLQRFSIWVILRSGTTKLIPAMSPENHTRI